MCVTVWVLRYKNKKNGDRGTIVFTATLNLKIFACRKFPGNLLNTKSNSLNLEVLGLRSETDHYHEEFLSLQPMFPPRYFDIYSSRVGAQKV